MRAQRARFGYVAVVLALLTVPWVMGPYAVATVSKILVFAVLAMSVNLLTGVTGLPTLGQSAYFGVGAYAGALTAIHLTDLGPVQVVVAVLAGAAAALLTGPVAVRARGVPFLMITLAIGEIAYSAAGRLDSVTHGTDGLSGIPPLVAAPGLAPTVNEGLVFYYVLAVFLLLYGTIALLLRSPFGLTLRGLRDNEARLKAVGYHSTGHALTAYVIAGGVAGAAGSLWASAQRFVAPGDLGFEVAALALLAVIVGGVGSMWGACLGAAVVIVARDYIGGNLDGHGPLLLGALFVVAVYLLPRGISGGVRQFKRPAREQEVAA